MRDHPARPGTRTVADLVQALRTIPKPDDKYWDTVEDLTNISHPSHLPHGHAHRRHSVLIAIERKRLGLGTVLEEHGEEAAAIAAITASELLHGVHRARTVKQRARREALVE